MRNFALLAVSAVALLGVGGAIAVEPAKNHFGLFHQFNEYDGEHGISDIAALDFVAGGDLETFGFAFDCKRTPPVNDKIKAVFAVRFQFRNSAAATPALASVISKVTTPAFPDPANPQFQCNGIHRTNYCGKNNCVTVDNGSPDANCNSNENLNDGDGPSGLCGTFPDDVILGLGIAHGGGDGTTRHLVVGNGLQGEYFNDQGQKTVNIYNVSTYAATGGAVIAQLNFTGDTADGEFLTKLATVADYLASNPGDEVRVGYLKDTPTGLNTKWFYYSIPGLTPIGSPANVVTAAPTP